MKASTTLPPPPPQIRKQLVLELEGGVSILELWNLLPCSVSSGLAHLLHQNFPHTTVEMGAQDFLLAEAAPDHA
jgi:hypothetical protein